MNQSVRLLAVLGFQKSGTTHLRNQLVNACAARTNVNEGCPALLTPHASFGRCSRFHNCTPAAAAAYACVDPGGVYSSADAFEHVDYDQLRGMGPFYTTSLAIVMLVREPADRAYAAYSMLRSWRMGPPIVGISKRLNFSSFVARDIDRIRTMRAGILGRCDWRQGVVCYSAYASGILRFRNAFIGATGVEPPIHYSVFERMRKDPLAQLNAVLELAGLPRQRNLSKTAFRRATEYGPPEKDLNTTLNRIRQFLARETERFYVLFGGRIPEWDAHQPWTQ